MPVFVQLRSIRYRSGIVEQTTRFTEHHLPDTPFARVLISWLVEIARVTRERVRNRRSHEVAKLSQAPGAMLSSADGVQTRPPTNFNP